MNRNAASDDFFSNDFESGQVTVEAPPISTEEAFEDLRRRFQEHHPESLGYVTRLPP